MTGTKLDRTQRKLYLAYVDGIGSILYACAGSYDRALRWYGTTGLTERERVYAQQRSIRMKEVADDMRYLTVRIHDHLNGLKNPGRKRPARR